ncbi:PTS sugar transporter subunit IIB [Zophobihabitans entericus]|uniref:PTS sugar transporter subunit IIB n=1 Tax=Zophobihabitans entericus TaxID=1635327 RepID=A0A6G9ICX9_9GAMM|nr:PTS sugar transporter subunit IIB [Zophobihabitans entericus]QIQ21697.1 PTS sugar transporter subunit IIB [Zophobihabitans entericus]
MKNIKLVRVDFRLIHGQVITKWKNIIAANQIIIVDDKLAKDPFLSDIYVMAAPPDVAVHVLPEDDFVAKVQQGTFDDGSSNVLILFKSIGNVRRIVEKGVPFSELQIGGLGGGENRKTVVTGVSIDTNDLEDLKFMQSKNVNVHFQVTPEEAKVGLDKAISKLGG